MTDFTPNTNLGAPSTRAGALPPSERMALLERLNATAGYTAPPTVFPPGTALIDVGEQNLRRVRAEMAALPELGVFADAFLGAERTRDNRDVTDSLSSLRMLPDGKLTRGLNGAASPSIGYTPTGLNQLVGAHREVLGLPSGFAGSLEWLSPAARSEAFNDLATRAAAVATTWRQKNPSEALTNPMELKRVYRTSVGANGERYLYAVTSPKHVGAAGGFAAMVRALTYHLPGVAKVRVTHQGHDRLDVEAIFPMMAREIRVGDVLWGSVSLTLSEAKDVSAGVADGLMRVLCVNLTRAFYGKDTEFSRKHIGAENFVRDLVSRIKDGTQRLAPFIQAFGDAYTDALPAGATPATVTEKFLKAGAATLPKALTGGSILASWNLDGERGAGNTRAGFAAALTRASQGLGISDAQVVEAAAGRLVAEGWGALA